MDDDFLAHAIIHPKKGETAAEAKAAAPDPGSVNAARATAAAAAAALGVELGDFIGKRPLSSAWRASREGEVFSLVALDPSTSPSEARRFAAAAERMHQLGDNLPGLLRVRAVVSPPAFLADLLTTGTAEDLPVLRWSLRRKVEFFRQAMRTMDALHQAGVVHGCLCPGNLQLRDDMHPVLAEVGLVSVRESFDGDADNAFGYGAYASPEVRAGTAADARSDVYSLGRLLHYLVIEAAPSDANLEALVAASKSNPRLLEIVRACTAESPRARYASASELLRALDPVFNELSRAEASPSKEALPSRVEGGRAREAAAHPRRQHAKWSELPTRQLCARAAALGLLMLLGSVAFSYLVGLSTPFRHELVGRIFALGGGLATLILPPVVSRRPWASRVTLALGCAALLRIFDPDLLQAAYHRGAERRLHGDDATRRQVLVELVQLNHDLRGLPMGGLDLHGVDLSAVDLRGADLSRTDLSGANLFMTMLAGTLLNGTRLSGADLTASSLGESVGFLTADCDASTRFPVGFRCVDGHPSDAR